LEDSPSKALEKSNPNGMAKLTVLSHREFKITLRRNRISHGRVKLSNMRPKKVGISLWMDGEENKVEDPTEFSGAHTTIFKKNQSTYASYQTFTRNK
jgi:hypothetical protein